jgi:hypothetical protein
MEQAEIQDEIFAYLEKMKGKKKLKEKDVIRTKIPLRRPSGK